MEEIILKAFARSTAGYFGRIASGSRIGTAYLRAPDESVALDYSAVIGITGTYRGSVYYTAARPMLDALLPLLGESTPDEKLCADLVGEIANTVSGNVREDLGAGFMISPPFVLEGRPTDVHASRGAPFYIIPITWDNHASRLLVTLSRNGDAEP